MTFSKITQSSHEIYEVVLLSLSRLSKRAKEFLNQNNYLLSISCTVNQLFKSSEFILWWDRAPWSAWRRWMEPASSYSCVVERHLIRSRTPLYGWRESGFSPDPVLRTFQTLIFQSSWHTGLARTKSLSMNFATKNILKQCRKIDQPWNIYINSKLMKLITSMWIHKSLYRDISDHPSSLAMINY